VPEANPEEGIVTKEMRLQCPLKVGGEVVWVENAAGKKRSGVLYGTLARLGGVENENTRSWPKWCLYLA